jgi:predicted MFS family arabinose efflux permease
MPMDDEKIRIYRYRWIVLAVFFLLNTVIEIQWIMLAPITKEAAGFYMVSELQVAFLSIIFMLVYIFISMPASYIIDTYGIRIGIGFGAVLTGVFGLMKGVFASSYGLLCVSQVGLAVAQPFILNAYTKLAAQWFPIHERATATGISSLGQYIGIIIAMAATPALVRMYNIEETMLLYGIVTLAVTVIFLFLIREKPPTPPCHAGHESRMKAMEGLRHIMKQKSMIILLILFFIGLGMFNAVTTWIEEILAPRGFTPVQAGISAALMLLGGIIGASLLPPLSDKYRKRRLFLILTMGCMIPGLVGLTFATSYGLLLASSFIFGFFIMSAGPIGFQYSAESSYPAPESMSQGLIILMGQVSGVIFIFGMDFFRADGTKSMTPFMIVFIILTVLNVALSLKLRESEIINTD